MTPGSTPRVWRVPQPPSPLTRPTYLVDGRCGFCLTWMDRVQRLFPGTFDAVSLYDFDLASVGLDLEQCEQEGHFLKPAGDGVIVRAGSQSWAGILLEQKVPARWIGVAMEHLPVRPIADVVYAWVARHRHRLPGATATCAPAIDHAWPVLSEDELDDVTGAASTR